MSEHLTVPFPRSETPNIPTLAVFTAFAAYRHHLDVTEKHATGPHDPVLAAVAAMREETVQRHPQFAAIEAYFVEAPDEEAMLTPEGFSIKFGLLESQWRDALAAGDSLTAEQLSTSMAVAAEEHPEHYSVMLQARQEITAQLDVNHAVPVN